MWGNLRVDVWHFAMIGAAVASIPLVFTTRRSVRWLYLTLFISIISCLFYQRALMIYIEESDQFRVDLVEVPVAAVIPLFATILNAIVTYRKRKKVSNDSSVCDDSQSGNENGDIRDSKR